LTGSPAGLVGLDIGFLAVGEALLLGFGLVRSPRSAVRFAGLAFMAGWAATGIVLSVALMAGLDLTVPLVVVCWGVVAGAGLLAGLRMPSRLSLAAREGNWTGRAIAAAGALLLATQLAMLLRRALASGAFQPDVWNFWLPKAKSIYYFGGLDTGVGGFTSFIHAEYPPLAPVADSASFRFMGAPDVLLLPVQHWVLAVAFFAALAGLLAERVRPAILWHSLAMLAFMPKLESVVGSLLGDEPLAELFVLAGLAAALWLLDGDRRLLALAALFLAAATLAKNEGLMLAIVLVVVLTAAAAGRRNRLEAVAVAAAPLLAAVSWRVWLGANDVSNKDADYRLGDLFDPGYLSSHSGRLWTAFRDLPDYVFAPDRALLAIPLLLLLAAVLVRREPRLTAFSVATPLIALAGYLAIYWIGKPEIHFYLDSSAERVTAAPVLLGVALFPLLLQSARPSGDSRRLP
jgi:hypothetical protein